VASHNALKVSSAPPNLAHYLLDRFIDLTDCHQTNTRTAAVS
jgi:hypothetical protein